MPRAPSTALVVAALATVYVMWGSTYLAIRVVVETLPPLLAASVRWIVAGALMYAYGRRRGGERPTRQHWWNATVIGTALCLGGNGLVSIAERRITSGMAALLVATVPLFMAGFDRMRNSARVPLPVTAGLILGFLGTAVLVRPQDGAGAVDQVGAATVLVASALWAAGSLYARRAALPESASVSTGMEMLAGGATMALVGAVGGEIGRFDAEAVSLSSVLAVVYLIVAGSLLGFNAYLWLLRNVRTSIATTYAYVNPLVAVLLGWLILEERVTATTLVGGAIIVLAVAIIVAASGGTSERGERPPDERPDLSSQELPT